MKIMSIAGDIEGFAEFDAKLTEVEEEATECRENISLHISCSPGGDIYTGLAYYARILDSPVHITTVGYGRLFSAAVLPFLAGKRRILSRYAWLLLHETQFQHDEDETDTMTTAKQDVEHTEATECQYYKLLAKHTGRSAKFWEKKIKGKGDIYFSAEEALHFGLCDELI